MQRTDGIVRPPLRSSKPAEGEAPPTGKGPDKTPDKPAETPADKPSKADKPAAEPADARLARLAKSPDKTVVALVGPPGTKAEAEALLKKMQASLAGVHSDPDTLQADVIQTPDGWRATVWPFPNREQAQLINATLIARGMKTKAVNF
ncbi:hypothetical protein DBR42_21440 [Pelomonas sp. HMWF004]|nr:hypothetical protein DBR42_21440 [Pelomonas sp. HMWF004]